MMGWEIVSGEADETTYTNAFKIDEELIEEAEESSEFATTHSLKETDSKLSSIKQINKQW